MMRRFFTALVAVFLSVSCHAQTYRTVQLNDIAHQLKNKNIPHYELKDSAGVIYQMGCRIFSEAQRNLFPAMVCDFLERMNLYFRVLKPARREALIADNQITVDLLNFYKVDSLCDFALSETDKIFTAVWTRDSAAICRFEFPKNYALISGLNIAEAQQNLCNVLGNSKITFDSFVYNDWSQLKSTPKYLMIDEGKYMIDKMKSVKYFNRSDTAPLFNVFFPEESWANVMQGLVESNATVNLELSKYDNSVTTIPVKLSRLVSFCLKDYSNCYFGVEEISDRGMTATVIYANSKYNYNHLLHMEIDPWGGVISVKMNAYIPTHNLKNLYNEKN